VRARELRSALGALDRLRDGLRGFVPEALPEGFLERLTSARFDLNLGDPEGALAELRSLREALLAG